MTKLRHFIPAFFIFILLFSCNKDDDYNTSPDFKLKFSCDTLLFDTVFTTLGSVTKQIMVYNPNNKPIKISSIRLSGGLQSMFRINVDGVQSLEHYNKEIASNDSLYIFVKVTVNPNNQSNPLIVNDSIIFSVNGNIQTLQLVAWGQDAYYHLPNKKIIFNDGSFLAYGFAGCNSPWQNNKPHVIFGYCVVDTDSVLTIPAGTKVHFAPNAVLWVYDGGTLNVQGNILNKVIFQGSRLESYYRNLPGQWGKIWLSRGSKDNIVNYAVFRNGNIGIQVDTVVNNNPTLTIENTIIENMSVAGIFAQGATIKAKNLVVTNCGQYSLVLSLGGNYEFLHSTFGNYWKYNYRSTPSVILNNYYKDNNQIIQTRPLTNAYFGNCIVYGANEEEILLDKNPNNIFNFKFDHCLLKTKNNTNDMNLFTSCIINFNPQFVDIENNNLKLNINSPAKNVGSPLITIFVPFDIEGVLRPTNACLGAYEYNASR